MAANTGSYVIPQVNKGETYTQPAGTTETIDNPLAPFRKDSSGAFHTAQTSTTRRFGYTYPELVDWGVSAEKLSSTVRGEIKKLYNPSGRLQGRSLESHMHGYAKRHQHHMNHQFKRQLGDNQTSAVRHNATEGSTAWTEKQWFINFSVNRNALGESFFIHFFLGTPPSDPEQWATGGSADLITSHAIFAGGHDASVVMPITGQIPLTRSVLSTGTDVQAEKKVVNFLKNNLKWRVQRVGDRSVVDGKELRDLEIKIVDQDVDQSDRADDLGSYGSITSIPNLSGRKASDAGGAVG